MHEQHTPEAQDICEICGLQAGGRTIELWRPRPSGWLCDVCDREAFMNWLAGFIDGEGCFTITSFKTSHSLRFRLGVRDDDAGIIGEIVARTGIGTITTSPGAGVRAPQIHWQVKSKSDCLVLMHLLDQFPLRAKKDRDYAIWRRALMEWCSDTRTQARMAAFKVELEEVRRYSLIDPTNGTTSELQSSDERGRMHT